jgi:hypothetical protein
MGARSRVLELSSRMQACIRTGSVQVRARPCRTCAGVSTCAQGRRPWARPLAGRQREERGQAAEQRPGSSWTDGKGPGAGLGDTPVRRARAARRTAATKLVDPGRDPGAGQDAGRGEGARQHEECGQRVCAGQVTQRGDDRRHRAEEGERDRHEARERDAGHAYARPRAAPPRAALPLRPARPALLGATVDETQALPGAAPRRRSSSTSTETLLKTAWALP